MTAPYQSVNSAAGKNRKVYGLSSSRGDLNAKADLAGLTAAALALMSKLYRPFSASYSSTCLKHAEEVYVIGEKNPGVTKQPGDDFYQDDDYRDSMM
jgi:hypothetical protein